MPAPFLPSMLFLQETNTIILSGEHFNLNLKEYLMSHLNWDGLKKINVNVLLDDTCIIGNGLAISQGTDVIPPMTSSTVSECTITGSHAPDSIFQHYMIADNKYAEGQYKASVKATTNVWWMFAFNTERTIGAYTIRADILINNTQLPKNWVLQGSNTGTNWINLHTVSNQTNWQSFEKRTFYLDQPARYKFFRIYIYQNNGHYLTDISEFELISATSTHLGPASFIWPNDATNAKVRLIISQNAKIIGSGGAGASGDYSSHGHPGGTAMIVDSPLVIENYGTIAGGGGGGAYVAQSPQRNWQGTGGDFIKAGAGPGAGYLPSIYQGHPLATLSTGGGGLRGGAPGGNLGQPGSNATPYAGGRAGYYIEGTDNVTWRSTGTLLGLSSQIVVSSY